MLMCLTIHAEVTPLELSENALRAGDVVLLDGGDYHARISRQGGAFLRFNSNQDSSTLTFTVGRLDQFDRFAAAWRGQTSCWMEPAFADHVSGVPEETQFLMARNKDGLHLLLIPLIDGGFRASIGGSQNGHLMLSAVSGSSTVLTRQVSGLYVIAGTEPAEMMTTAAGEIRHHLTPGRPAAPRVMPEFSRYLGWCTWNAFYDKVSEPLILDAMNRFDEGGVSPGFVLIDDGWQENKNGYLTGYGAIPEKFPRGIGGLGMELKEKRGVKQMLVWQTCWGYWNGTSPELSQTGAEMRKAVIPERNRIPAGKSVKDLPAKEAALANFYPDVFRTTVMGFPDFAKFYSSYHRTLRDQGVDGVKVDAMTWVEAYGENHGGRIAMMGELVGAMEQYSSRIFANNNIHCSSSSNDFLLMASRNSVTRSSTDFFPDIPASHGEHVFKNAMNGFWMGEFVIPDWDMFQSGHPAGAFHAAARAISGGPVYIADEPGKNDFPLLRKLTLSDRTVPPCTSWAHLSKDSFFIDIRKSGKPVKIVNTHPAGGVIGAFHCGYGDTAPAMVKGEVRPSDIPGMAEGKFAVFSHQSGRLSIIEPGGFLPVELPQLGFEIHTVAPVIDRIAVIGLTDKFNSGGTIKSIERAPGTVKIQLLDGGPFLAHVGSKPRSLKVNGETADFTHDAKAGTLKVDVRHQGLSEIEIAL